MIVSFTIDPLLRVDGLKALASVASLGDAGAKALMQGRDYVPKHYPWHWLAAGAVLATLGTLRASRVLVPCPRIGAVEKV